MLELFGIKRNQLFCSSVDGYKIPLGANIFDYLREQFENHNLFVILMLSKNYYKSPACLNEMGAAWVLRAEYQSILLPGFAFKNVSGAIDPQKISFKLDDLNERQNRMTELKDKLIDLFALDYADHSIWERHRADFLKKVDGISNATKI